MSEAPPGWVTLDLGTIAARTSNVDPGRFPDEEFELYSVPSFAEGRPDAVIGAQVKSSKQAVAQDDVLLCKIVPHINRVWTVAPKEKRRQIASGEWIVYRDHHCDPNYLRYCLSEAAFRDEFMKTVSGVGGSLMRARPSEVAKIAISIAPRLEQRRIVAKIDSLSAKSQRARENLDHIPRLVEKYKQAILTAAFRGQLTSEWRRGRNIAAQTTQFDRLPKELSGYSLPNSWKVTSLAEAAMNHDGKRIPVRSSDRANRQGQFPYYGASGPIDTIDDYLFDGEFVLIGEDGANLVSRSTPIAFLASGKFWVNNHAHILQAGPDTSNKWLCWYVNMIDLVPYVTGSAQPKLTQAALNRIALPLPILDEQFEIVSRIDAAFALIDRLALEVTGARKLLDRLDRAILSKAFRGELVPQDPNDEPAAVLLERIKARSKSPSAAKESRSRSKVPAAGMKG